MDLKIMLSKIDKGRSLFKVTLRVPTDPKNSIDEIVATISTALNQLNSKTLVIPGKTKK